MQTDTQQKTLAELFEEGKAKPVLLDGIPVQIDFRRTVIDGTTIEVEMLSKRFFGNPALCVHIKDGKFQINNRSDSEFDKNEICINWFKKAPKKFTINILLDKSSSTEIIFYNAWWNIFGEFESSFDYDGVIVESKDSRFLLNFNNGRNGRLTFDDLIIGLTFFDPE